MKKITIILLYLTFHISAIAQISTDFDKLRILTHDEFSELGKKNPKWVNKRPIVLEFHHSTGGALFYYGSSHIFDPDDPLLKDIEKRWNKFKPDIAFWEGGNPDRKSNLPDQLETIIREKGEAGFVRYLARQNSIMDKTLEPSPFAIIVELRRTFSDTEILVHGILTQTEQAKRKGKSNAELDSILAIGLKKARSAGFIEIPENPIQFELCVKRIIPLVENWHDVVLDMIAPKPLKDPAINRIQQISTLSSIIRDRNMLALLLGEVRNGKKVFAVVGASHLIMQQPALEEFFDKRHKN